MGYGGEVRGGGTGGGGRVGCTAGGDLILFDLSTDLEAHRPPGGRSMALATTLHIGRPCMQCTPSRVRGPGGGGVRPVAVPWAG